MARCRFCGKWFGSAQGVRGHLRACPNYRSGQVKPDEVKARQPIQAQVKARRPQAQGSGFDPVAHMKAEAEKAELRLKLRQIESAHEDLDEKEIAKQGRKREEAETAMRREREQARARRQAELELQERKQKEQAERERQRRRRERIQRAKEAAVWSSLFPGSSDRVPTDLKAQVKREIDKELSALPIDELPDHEVEEIAQGIRDRLYRPVMEAQDEAKRQQAEREQQEWEKRLKAVTEREERKEKVRPLKDYGYQFASDELNELEVKPSIERYLILEKVGEKLWSTLDGTESKAEVEDIVEAILYDEYERLK